MEKKTSCLLCVLTALLLTVLYLWAALRPGVWLRDAFLYRQADGSFSGKSRTVRRPRRKRNPRS